MRLKHQLFVVLLTTSAILITLMFVISSWSFSRGFLGYVNSAEKQRLQPLLESIAREYDDNDGWGWVAGDSRAWKQLLSEYARNLWTKGGRRGPRPKPVDHLGDQPGDDERPKHASKKDRPEHGRDHFRPPPPTRSDRIRHFVLADSNKQIIAGPSRLPDKAVWVPVSSSEQVIGYVGIRRMTRLNSKLDQAFDDQQRRSFAWAALAMVVLSALLSVPLASLLVKPLLKLNSAISEVGKGNYGHRVELTRNDEIADLARGINNMASTLEMNRDARQRWIAEISHELRTPVAVLQGELEAMQDGIRKMDSQSVDSIHAEVLKLAQLIDDLHQLSQSDIGALECQMDKLCLADLLESRIRLAEATLQGAQLTYSVEAKDRPYLINADEHRVGQLISNLLQNSARYTDAPGEIRVALSADINSVELVWEDSSPGVSEPEIALLFEPLYRAEKSRSRQLGGAGLGLSIVMRIVKAHGGSIAAMPSRLGGLKLVIRFPSINGGVLEKA